jgi:hypothetical protein
MTDMAVLPDMRTLERARGQGTLVVFKHSPT